MYALYYSSILDLWTLDKQEYTIMCTSEQVPAAPEDIPQGYVNICLECYLLLGDGI